MISFQNCTPQTDLGDGSEDNSSLSDPNPFAFDLSIDHFALMSCNTNGLSHKNHNGQFTYKWGAYQNGLAAPGRAGLRLSDKFMAKYGRKVPAKIFTVLEDSPKNQNLEIVSGLYIPGEFLSRKTDDQSAFYRNNHTNLQVNSYIKDLSLNSNKTLSYFPSVAISSGININSNLEGFMFRRTLVSDAVIRGFKDEFTSLINFDQLSTYPMAIGFGHASELAKGEAKPLVGEDGGYQATTAIGRSYRPQFTGINSNYLRYLGGVSEGSLNGERISSSWSCPSALRFKIVQRKDITSGKVSCSPKIVSNSLLASQTSNGRALRSLANVLDLGLWEVDFDRKCIVRRSVVDIDNCYIDKYNPYVNSQGKIEVPKAVKIDYNQTICASSNPTRNETVGGQANQKVFYACPHYVSVCVRTN